MALNFARSNRHGRCAGREIFSCTNTAKRSFTNKSIRNERERAPLKCLLRVRCATHRGDDFTRFNLHACFADPRGFAQ